MYNYIKIDLKNQENHGRNSHNCKPLSRCNNHKICPTCASIRERKIKDSISHITEKHIKNFKHKKYLVIKSKDENTNVYMKNSDIDLFLKDFISMKRNKNFIISEKAHYFITKEISYNDKFKYNPHANIILLSDKFNINNKQFQDLLKRYNLDCYVKDIYKKDNSFSKSLKDLISYCIKFDKDRARLESDISITKSKRDIFKSSLFDKGNYSKLQRNLYIYIREIKANSKAKLQQAKAIFKRNAKKTNPKQYKRLLISLQKKKKSIIYTERRQIQRLKRRFASKFNPSGAYREPV